MKKILLGLGSIALALAIFAGGVYASEQGWLNFSGEEQIAESENHLNEIMDILRQVNDGKITAEQAELRLKGEVTQLTEDKNNLNNQLTDAQDDIEYLEGLLEGLAGDTPGQKINKLKEANDNLRGQNAQLETKITGFQEDNERLQGTIELRDNEIVGLENDVANLEEQLANAPEDQTEYVAHLEAELELANSLVETHHKATSDALEEARTYGDE